MSNPLYTLLNMESVRGYLLMLEWNLRKEDKHGLADKVKLMLDEINGLIIIYRATE